MLITFDELAHAYKIDRQRVPSVTQVLAPQNDWSFVEAWRLEAAAAIGRDVHAAVSLMVRGTLDWATVDDAIAPYVRAAEMFIRQSGGVVIAAEQIVGSKTYGVAGTMDVLMSRGRWLYFVDWKVSAAVPSTVGAQLAAYQVLWTETNNGGKRLSRARRVCVRLGADTYRADRMDDYANDWNLFKSCLNAHQHRERKSYA